MMKFASFETIVEMIYKYAIPAPKNECSKPLQLGVSFAGGYVAGVFCAIVSHPADNLVSFLNNAQGATVGDVSFLPCVQLLTTFLPCVQFLATFHICLGIFFSKYVYCMLRL
jgi:solute carrier family 25 phosphate transporter 3